MTIQFSGWRAFWFVLFVAMAGASLAVCIATSPNESFISGLLMGFSQVPFTLFLMFHDIKKR